MTFENEPGTSIQTWGGWDQEEADRDKRETETKGVFFKISKPSTILRFLPPPKGQKNPFIKTHQHFVRLDDNDDQSLVVYNCPRRMKLHNHCPLCASADKKKSTGVKEDRERAFELYPKLRVYAAVIDRSDPDKGPQIFPFGKKIFEQLLNLREDGNFTHPLGDKGEGGFDIKIIKKGSTKNDTSYDVKGSRNNTPLSDDPELMQDWLSKLPDLTQYAYVPTAEEIDEKIDAAMEGDEAPPPAREAAPARRGSGRAIEPATAGGGRRGTIETQGETVEEDAGGWGSDDDIPF